MKSNSKKHLFDVQWVVDTYILDTRENQNDLLPAIRNAGCKLIECKYIPFSIEQNYGDVDSSQPTILYGTHGFIKNCKLPLIPGAYGHNSNMNCNVYYANIPWFWMLNSEYMMVPYQYIEDHIDELLKTFNGKFFLRPNSGFKSFPGTVISNKNDLKSTNFALLYPEEICLIAPVKKLKGEFRFIVCDGKVIDGSCYRWNGVLDIRHDWNNDCFWLAEQMAKHSWQPDTVYTVDVALTDSNKINGSGPFIIEINSFACAGLYACDKELIVREVSNQALKEWHIG